MSYAILWAKAEVASDTIAQRLRQFLAASQATSAKLIDEIEIVVSPITYHKFVFCECEYDATWSGSFGYSRKEYEQYFDSSGNAQRRTVEKVDWRPEHGTDRGTVRYFLPGSELISEQLLAYTYNCPRPALQVCTDETLTSDEFSIPSEPWFSGRDDSFERDLVGKKLSRFIKGNRLRDWVTNWTGKKIYRKCYLPIAQASFKWKGKEYSYYCGAWKDAEVLGDLPPSGLLDSQSGRITAGFSGAAFLAFVGGMILGKPPEGIGVSLAGVVMWLFFSFLIAAIVSGLFHDFDTKKAKSRSLGVDFKPIKFSERVFSRFPSSRETGLSCYAIILSYLGFSAFATLPMGGDPTPLGKVFAWTVLLSFVGGWGSLVYFTRSHFLNKEDINED
jgi:hypothetical protein